MDLICRAHQVGNPCRAPLLFIAPLYGLRATLALVRNCGSRGLSVTFFCRPVLEVMRRIMLMQTQLFYYCLTGRRGRVRVLREAAFGDAILGAELLWRVRQRGRDDECGRYIAVFLPGMYPPSPIRSAIAYV